MKKITTLLLIGAILASCAGKRNSYNISGKIIGTDSGTVYLQKYEISDWVKIDSSKLDKGSFSFKGKIGLPEMWFITDKSKLFLPVFVENANITIEVYADSVDKANITGSATHDLFKKYQKQNDSLNKLMEACYKVYRAAKEANDTLKMKKADSTSDALDKAVKANVVAFSKANPASVIGPYLIMRSAYQFELPELEESSAAFDTSLNTSTYVQTIRKRIDVLKSVQIGQVAPDFTMNDTTGKPLTLSSLKGKILLVDFWASWCGPCRGENPNVVKAFKAYNKKGFDILGVSFDKDHAKWVKAIKDDGLTWNHVSDLQGWNNSAGKLYGVMSIPANVLLDKDQKIIGRNLRGEDLTKKLTELLGPAAPEKKAVAKKGKK
ncbi:MAG: TlpA disulfide reductase family protein [Bacteroidetes bacterium]|nr:TlpA disulfide reductase family protein [Bacteroidota bacterium]